jgi:anaerobic glycerol-3-phosphate dehydrogenase
MRGTARAIRRVKPLRHDALTTELARLAKHNSAVLLEMLIENDAQVRAAQQLCQQSLTLLDWLPPQVPTVKLKQVERAQDRTSERAVSKTARPFSSQTIASPSIKQL